LVHPRAKTLSSASYLVQEDLVLVGPPESNLNQSEPVTLAALARLPLVLPSSPHGLRVIVERAAAKAKVKLEVRFGADSFRVLKDLVENGLGYTAPPMSSISRECRDGRLQSAPLVQPKVTRQLILCLPTDRTSSRATMTVTRLAREGIAKPGDAGDWQARLMIKLHRRPAHRS
jgi:LysR family nitrogen assimilation transcriptional regulator